MNDDEIVTTTIETVTATFTNADAEDVERYIARMEADGYTVESVREY